ncbi:MAG TPA: hypothetical protein VD704_08840 [Gaiellaceae bacterium]|nr:hypothetical protein [Gaiellaceae bacterium]
MFAELERCGRCHQRYPAAFGHRCPQGSFTERRGEDFELQLAAWLATPEGRFAAYLARRGREA